MKQAMSKSDCIQLDYKKKLTMQTGQEFTDLSSNKYEVRLINGFGSAELLFLTNPLKRDFLSFHNENANNCTTYQTELDTMLVMKLLISACVHNEPRFHHCGSHYVDRMTQQFDTETHLLQLPELTQQHWGIYTTCVLSLKLQLLCRVVYSLSEQG